MILAGIKLSLLGMTVVFLFLIVLILAVNLAFRLLSEKSAAEFIEMEAAAVSKKRRAFTKTEDSVLVAVISAAIAAHRARIKPAR